MEEFDPERDYPPTGAILRGMDHGVQSSVCFDGVMWRVTSGPHAGRVSRPFSPAGIATAGRWALKREMIPDDAQRQTLDVATPAARRPGSVWVELTGADASNRP